LGEAMQRIGQPAVIGQLIAGILLGPSVFGAIWPEAQRAVFTANPQQQSMIDAVSQLGILMLLLLTGMETDLRLVKKARRAAISTSAAGIIVPFACGFALGELLPAAMLPKPDQRIITSLFLGTALSIASVKIVAMVVREMGFMRRNVGITLIASAIIDDTVGWVIVAIISGLAVHGRWTHSAWVRACSERQSFLRSALRSGGVWCSASSAGPTTVLSAKCRWSPQFSSSWARWRSRRI
jgi:Kef-type K+ transport system membrane component KefB